MIPTISPLAVSLSSATQSVALAAAQPAQAVTTRPATPPGKSEGARRRERREERETVQNKGGENGRGGGTNIVV